jgi:Dimerisation domain
MPPPKPIFWLGTIVLPALEAFRKAVMPPPLYLMQRYIMGFMYSQTIYTVAKLGIADVLSGGPLTAAEIAKKLGMPLSALPPGCQLL